MIKTAALEGKKCIQFVLRTLHARCKNLNNLIKVKTQSQIKIDTYIFFKILEYMLQQALLFYNSVYNIIVVDL